MQDNISRDNLIGAAVALDTAEYLLQALQEDYFDLDSSKLEGQRAIVYEFSRARAKTAALRLALEQISSAFSELKINPYS